MRWTRGDLVGDEAGHPRAALAAERYYLVDLRSWWNASGPGEREPRAVLPCNVPILKLSTDLLFWPINKYRITPIVADVEGVQSCSMQLILSE